MRCTIRLLLGTALVTSSGLFAADPTFHLKNNSKDAIQIDIMQNNRSITGLQRVAKGGTSAYQLDINKPTTLEIHYCPTAEHCKTKLPLKKIVKIKPKKTVYIKFDGNKVVPQEGSKVTGKTTDGYSTKNNVSKSDLSVSDGTTAGYNQSPPPPTDMPPALPAGYKPGKPAGYKQSPPPTDMPPALPAGYKQSPPPTDMPPALPAGYKQSPPPPTDMPPALPAGYKPGKPAGYK